MLQVSEAIKKIEYIYQHFQDHEKVYETDTNLTTHQSDSTLYPQVNNNIEHIFFKNVIDSYYLDSQIKDDFACTITCYNHNHANNTQDTNPQCTLACDHISQQLQSLADAQQQHTVYTKEMDASLFTTDTFTPCTFNITTSDLETHNQSDQHNNDLKAQGIHFYSKHKYRDTFGNSHIQYHDFDNGDTLTFADK